MKHEAPNKVIQKPSIQYSFVANHRDTMLALATTHLAARELRMVLAVMNQTNGYLRDEDSITTSYMATLTNIPSSEVSHVRASLITKGILTYHSNGAAHIYSVNRPPWHRVHTPRQPLVKTDEFSEPLNAPPKTDGSSKLTNTLVKTDEHDSSKLTNTLVKTDEFSATTKENLKKTTKENLKKTRARGLFSSKRKKEIGKTFIIEMTELYRDTWSKDEVRRIIEESLAHKAAGKWVDLEVYVRGWLRREAEKKREKDKPELGDHNKTPWGHMKRTDPRSYL